MGEKPSKVSEVVNKVQERINLLFLAELAKEAKKIREERLKKIESQKQNEA